METKVENDPISHLVHLFVKKKLLPQEFKGKSFVPFIFKNPLQAYLFPFQLSWLYLDFLV